MPPALSERGQLKVAGFDADAAGDVVLDVIQPLALLGGEVPSGSFLHRQPALEPLLHTLGEWRQFLFVSNGVAHQRHNVGHHPLAGAAHPGLLKLPVGVPTAVPESMSGAGLASESAKARISA